MRQPLAWLLTLAHDRARARDEYAAIARLEPGIATAENGLGDLLRAVDPDDSERHYRICADGGRRRRPAWWGSRGCAGRAASARRTSI